jgi:hypothetical protein
VLILQTYGREDGHADLAQRYVDHEVVANAQDATPLCNRCAGSNPRVSAGSGAVVG